MTCGATTSVGEGERWRAAAARAVGLGKRAVGRGEGMGCAGPFGGRGGAEEEGHARAGPMAAQCGRGGGETSGPEGEGRMSPVSFSFL